MPSSLPKRERERGGGKEEGRGRGRERETFEGLAGIPTPSLPSPPAERSIYSKFQVAAHAIPCRTIVPGNQFPRRSLSLSPQRQLNRIPLREFMRQRPPPPPPRPSDVFAEKLEKRTIVEGCLFFFLPRGRKKEVVSRETDPRRETRSSYPAKFESNSFKQATPVFPPAPYNNNHETNFKIAFDRSAQCDFASKKEKVSRVFIENLLIFALSKEEARLGGRKSRKKKTRSEQGRGRRAGLDVGSFNGRFTYYRH